MTVYVVKSADHLDADTVWGVYSTYELAAQAREIVLRDAVLEHWASAVSVEPFFVDAPPVDE
jgi:hypothetical protein